MDTSELLEEYRAVRLLLLKRGQGDKEEVAEKEERIEEFIAYLEDYLFQHDWHGTEKGERSRTYANKADPKTHIQLRYSITYPDTRTFYRVEVQLKRRRFLLDKVVAEGETVFARI